jgi:pimeloyl-ACP methyl ester carboxylesterase
MKLRTGDVSLWFDVEGSALVADGPAMRPRPTIVLLHGGPGVDHSGWKPWASELATFAQVVYVDHRGNGRSDRSTPDRWTLAQWGDDVRALCDGLGIEKPIVVGHSFGAAVAMSYATRHPDHPGKLVLLAGTPRFSVERAVVGLGRRGGQRAADVARAFYDKPREHLGAYLRTCVALYGLKPKAFTLGRVVVNLEVILHYVEGEMCRYDFTQALGRVTCPTLAISGAEDPIFPTESYHELLAALPREHTRGVLLPDAAHELVRDAPERLLEELRAFVQL